MVTLQQSTQPSAHGLVELVGTGLCLHGHELFGDGFQIAGHISRFWSTGSWTRVVSGNAILQLLFINAYNVASVWSLSAVFHRFSLRSSHKPKRRVLTLSLSNLSFLIFCEESFTTSPGYHASSDAATAPRVSKKRRKEIEGTPTEGRKLLSLN